ncbi:hypothetical protein BH09PSE5_BH09PSE5_41680 [soil metagenome]
MPSNDMDVADSRGRDEQDWRIVGHCYGVCLLQGSGLADYQKAHAYAAIVGLLVLVVELSIGALMGFSSS